MKKETYVELYKQISRKIRRAVEGQKKRVVFEVPAFLVYDRLKATSYLKRQLELGGFIVHITGNFGLSITWKVKKDKVGSGPMDHIEDFPTLVNLKKVANRYRRDAQ